MLEVLFFPLSAFLLNQVARLEACGMLLFQDAWWSAKSDGKPRFMTTWVYPSKMSQTESENICIFHVSRFFHGKKTSIERCKWLLWPRAQKIGASGCHVVRTYAYPETVVQEDRDPTFGTEMLVDWGEMDCWNWKWIQKSFCFCEPTSWEEIGNPAEKHPSYLINWI